MIMTFILNDAINVDVQIFRSTTDNHYELCFKKDHYIDSILISYSEAKHIAEHLSLLITDI